MLVPQSGWPLHFARGVSGYLNSAFLGLFYTSCGPSFSGHGYPTQRAANTSCPRSGRSWLLELRVSRTFRGRSPVGAPGRVAGGHFRRAQPSQFAHGCAPTGERLRGYFFVGRNSFRFSVPLVPFQRANRSAGKKRNEFRSTAPRLRVLGKSQNWLIVAHQLTSAYLFVGARQLVRQDGWQAAIFGGRNRPSLLMVVHQLASASEVTSS